MRVRLLLIASVLCATTYGCGTTPTEQPKTAAQTAAAHPRSEPVYTTGSRLPSNGSGSVQGVSRDEWRDERRNVPGNQQIFK
jgi:hypothetical protein